MACVQLKMIKARGGGERGERREGKKESEGDGGGGDRQREMEKGELIFPLGLCISWLGNRVEMERKDKKDLVLVSSTLLWQGGFSGAGLASCVVKQLGEV